MRKVGIVVVGLALLAGAALAQAPGAGIPRGADGKPDFSGIWQSLSGAEYGLEPHLGSKDTPPSAGVVEGDVIPYKPEALAQRAKNLAARDTLDPRTKCFTLGAVRGLYGNEPVQIFQRPRDLTVLYEFGHPVRTIHTNGTQHPDGHIDFWLGDSRGHWEGDTLVVDVVDFSGDTWLDRAGDFHSDELHLVERWSYLDRNTIRYRATFEDPKVYTKPWSMEVLLYRRLEPNVQLIENYCATNEFDEYYPVPAKK
ncbi:MAG: hypothetical protein ABL967_07970 [Bryobacteraceae bacterium]